MITAHEKIEAPTRLTEIIVRQLKIAGMFELTKAILQIGSKDGLEEILRSSFPDSLNLTQFLSLLEIIQAYKYENSLSELTSVVLNFKYHTIRRKLTTPEGKKAYLIAYLRNLMDKITANKLLNNNMEILYFINIHDDEDEIRLITHALAKRIKKTTFYNYRHDNNLQIIFSTLKSSLAKQLYFEKIKPFILEKVKTNLFAYVLEYIPETILIRLINEEKLICQEKYVKQDEYLTILESRFTPKTLQLINSLCVEYYITKFPTIEEFIYKTKQNNDIQATRQKKIEDYFVLLNCGLFEELIKDLNDWKVFTTFLIYSFYPSYLIDTCENEKLRTHLFKIATPFEIISTLNDIVNTMNANNVFVLNDEIQVAVDIISIVIKSQSHLSGNNIETKELTISLFKANLDLFLQATTNYEKFSLTLQRPELSKECKTIYYAAVKEQKNAMQHDQDSIMKALVIMPEDYFTLFLDDFKEEIKQGLFPNDLVLPNNALIACLNVINGMSNRHFKNYLNSVFKTNIPNFEQFKSHFLSLDKNNQIHLIFLLLKFRLWPLILKNKEQLEKILTFFNSANFNAQQKYRLKQYVITLICQCSAVWATTKPDANFYNKFLKNIMNEQFGFKELKVNFNELSTNLSSIQAECLLSLSLQSLGDPEYYIFHIEALRNFAIDSRHKLIYEHVFRSFKEKIDNNSYDNILKNLTQFMNVFIENLKRYSYRIQDPFGRFCFHSTHSKTEDRFITIHKHIQNNNPLEALLFIITEYNMKQSNTINECYNNSIEFFRRDIPEVFAQANRI